MARTVMALAFPPTPRTPITTLLQAVFRAREARVMPQREGIPFRHADGRPSRPTNVVAKTTGRARQRKPAEKQVIPAFATEYEPEQTIVATQARCVHFLPADFERRFPVRVTMRSAVGGKAPWYEVETYHVNVRRWVVRQTETGRTQAFAIAQQMRLMDEPDDDNGECDE